MRRIVAGWLAVGVLASAAAAAPPRIRLATLAPKGTVFERVLLEMGEQWRNAPGGGARLILYTDGRMGGEAEVVKRMRVGQIEAAMLTATGLAQIDDAVTAIQNMPMMFRSLDEVDYVRGKLQADLEKKFLARGFVLLATGDTGWVKFFSTKPAAMPDDFKKLKLFAWSGDTKVIDLWKAAGFNPIPLEVTDILTGLRTGLIEAVCSSATYALAGQFDGPAPHMLDLDWAPLVGGLVMTKDAWDRLDEQSREAMLKAAKWAGAEVQRRSREENDEAVKAMQKRGLTVHPASPEVVDAWRKTAEAAYPAIRTKSVPTDQFDRVVELLKEYRAAQKGK